MRQQIKPNGETINGQLIYWAVALSSP